MRAGWLFSAALAAAAAAATLGSIPARAGPPAPSPSRPPDTLAVVIGYNGGRPGLPTLRFADDDAVRFALLLRGMERLGRSTRIWLLADLDAETTAGLARAHLEAPVSGPPTRRALTAALAEVGRDLAARPAGAPPPILYIIYAGHGLGGSILLKPEGGPDAAITGHELRAAVAELAQLSPGLRTFLFVDACRSQSLFTERGGDREIGPDLSGAAAALEQRASAVSIGVLTAAAAGKPAGEVKDLGAGYFSHVLASGLAGAADADGDEVVSFGELVAFVAFNTERLTGQRPWFAPPGGDLGATAVDLRGGGARLDLSTAPAGRYLVEASTGRPIFAEAYKGGQRPLRLALPVGRYRVVRTDARQARLAEVELQTGRPLDLARAAWSDDASPPLAVSARGGGPDDAAGGAGGVPLAFESVFTPEAVSTLTAGYDAGRAPVVTIASARWTLGAALGLAGAPLDLGGPEAGISARYRRRAGRQGHFFVGARLAAFRSSHDQAGSYALERYTLLAEGGPRWAVSDRLDVSLAAFGGGATLIRRAGAGGVSGDTLAPVVGGGAGAELALGGSWRLFMDARYTLSWFHVDGDRAATGAPGADVGLALGF